MGRIVVGHDGSQHGEAAVREALVLGRALGLPVIVVRAVSLDRSGFAKGTLAAEPVEDIEARETAVLTDEVAALATDFPDVPLEAYARQGNPAPVLLHEAEGARLLVVGSRGLGGVSRLIGSVSDRVVAHADTTVVVVRGESG